MKRFLLISVLLFICIQLSYAQTWRRAADWGNDYTDILWINDEVAFITGKNIILKTIDGGLSWVEQEAPTDERMTALDFFNQNLGIIVGEKGRIYRTTNSGEAWQIININSTEDFTSVKFLSQNRVILSGKKGAAFQSNNAGVSWTPLNINIQEDLNAIHFINSQNGFMVTSGSQILKTVNGGNNWTTFQTEFDRSLNDIYFADDTTGYAVGDQGTIIKTINGGNTWEFINSGVDVNFTKVAFSRANVNIGLITGENGFLMRTANAGLTIAAVGSRTVQDILGLSFRTNSNVVFAVANSGVVISSTNAGGGWALRLSGNNNNYTATQFKTENIGYIIGQNGLILSTGNGGNTFANRSRPLSLPFHTLYFTTNALGYVGGNTGNIIKTTNSGGGWTALNPGTNRNIFGLYFIDNNLGYAVGGRGYISKTENGGVNWSTIATGNLSFDYKDIKFFEDHTGLIVGEQGFLSRTENGEVWNAVNLGINQTLQAIEILDTNTAIVVGNQGTIFKTDDSGKTWSKINHSFNQNFKDVAFLDNLVGFIAGEKGLIIKTIDGGLTWEKIFTGTFQNFTGISFGDLNTGYAVGDAGSFFKYTCQVPPTPTTIFGEKNICISQQAYSIQGTDEPGVTYDWRVDGGTILEGQGSTRIIVRWDGPGRNAVMVRGQNNCGNGATRALEVAVSTEPGSVADIIGDGAVCLNSFMEYSVDSLAGTTYNWNATGGVIRQGQGTGKVTVEWTNLNDQTLRVTPVNPCGSGSVVQKAIRVMNEPGQPSTIKGNSISGLEMEEVYEVTSVTDNSYQWTVSSGGQIRSGQGSEKITVLWQQEGDHSIQVTPINTCGTGPERILEVNVSFVTSIGREINDSAIKVYPNPSSGNIYLELSGVSDLHQVQVINALGQIIYENKLVDIPSIIEIQQLPKGIHTIRLQGKYLDQFRKVVIR
ncbi:MAG TPA: YCF48-related protein [Anditalea sp.]|nr:YCF48-related protein [Anditalea sp.]